MSSLPDVDEMARPLAGHDEQSVDADVVSGPGIARRELLSSRGDPAEAMLIQGQASSIGAAPLLDLNERHDAAAPGDEVDLAAANPGALREDSPTMEPEPPSRENLRPPSALFCLNPVQPPPPSSSARA